ncbi:uncharacterized protein LOC110053100 isoform X2 [Orbicella faveolata]|uniref:uncharacterized protein LOC110053100 isoform X2 n=1 Tax=Orbicella faveolata TaxID=48498 RepID=UPI0009E2567B|nr:uncharacterized protein LOC110053100 isoform X2 [Orbicella faveolata]
MFKSETDAKRYLEADMWCHFGRAIIRGPNEDEAAEGVWSIEDATGKFRSSAEGNYWKVAFNEGVDVLEDIFKMHYREKMPEEYTEYATRYDLTFLSPCCYQIRCKVWVAKEATRKKLEDIPIPSSDVKNILEEIHFEDESTRSRCRGWLIVASRRYLQADILFPGCEFDCRFSIRGKTERAEAFDYVPKEEVRRVLSQYLSGLTLTKDDAFGLRLPEKEIPEGFRFIHKRSSKRTVYPAKPGFSIILSKECSWRSVVAEESSRESIDLHLHCDEWDQSFSSGQWEPEVIVRKLPEFLQFVKEVQGFVVREIQRSGPLEAPPEILARGQLALEVYNNALAEGKASVKRVPLMLIGQDRSGKTSLKKSLKGIVFDPDEDSTVGIDVDRYHFKVTTETWMTGMRDEESTTDAEAFSFEHNAARLVAERLMEVDNVIGSERRADVGSENYGLEMTEIPIETQFRESSTDPEPIDSQKPDLLAGEVPDSREFSIEGDALFITQVQMSNFEEIAGRTETLLQDGWAENSGDIHSIMWDFAGQSVYYVTHPLFLTARAIYLLAYDLSQSPYDIAKPVVKQGVFKEFQDNFNLKTNLDYLDFWLTSVASLASQDQQTDIGHESEVLPKKIPAVFLVCTHADEPHKGCDPFKLAKEIFGTLKSKPHGSQLYDVFVVDNTKSGSRSECPEVMRLREEVLAVAKELPHVNEVIPIKWLRYEKALETLKNKGYKWISLTQAKHIMSKVCSINNDGEMLTLLNFLHDLRLLIHFDDTSELNDVVVLDPQWLIDVFKEVITVRPYHSKDKRFVDLWCQLEREGILEEKLLRHVWSSLIRRTETCECLIAIMEKFSLLCPLPLPVDGSRSKQYLVPSMLKSHPTNAISDLVASAQIPPLFLKFETGQVPAGFFPRLVLEFFRWCIDRFPRQEPPQLFNGFARFYIQPGEGRSVVLLCHSLSIELLILTSNKTFDTSDGNLACAVRTQLASMIKCMQNKFFWVKNVVCELNFLCPVCCRGREVRFCRNHHAEGCKKEECLHFFPDSKLVTGDKQVFCSRSATAQDNRVLVAHFAPWFPSEHDKELSDEQDGRLLIYVQGHCDTSLALPCEVLTTLQSQLDSRPENVVDKFLQNLQLEYTSLEQPEPETRKWIRCLARKANDLNRLDVVKHLRQITPAGATGPLLPKDLRVLDIPQQQKSDLSVFLSGGDEWMLLAERMGLNSERIRFLDRRYPNSAGALLDYVGERSDMTVGNLYDLFNECGLPGLADRL